MNSAKEDLRDPSLRRVGIISSISLSVVTLFTFAVAFMTPPLSGPLAAGQRILYPYTNILERFPRDYYWMYPALLMMLIFIVYLATIDQYAAPGRKVFSRIALIFGAMAAGILFTDYFVQLTVIQPSLLNGELEGIALLSQYNPHGIFIALEEAGYLLMAVAILFLAPVFAGRGKVKGALRWTAVLNFLLAIISLAVITAIYGISREYIFEIAIITLDFASLFILGLLSARLFAMREDYNN